MEPQFWHKKWQGNDIGFHEAEVNPHLLKHISDLAPKPPARIFVPLCGKTRDIAWFLDQGYQVVGAELSELAIRELFTGLAINPKTEPFHGGTRFMGPGIDIFVGDIFDLSVQDVGQIDFVYDRAALVALPSQMRSKYAAQVANLTAHAPQLVLSFEYDQRVLNGPPFSVDGKELAQVYGQEFEFQERDRSPIEGRLEARLAGSAQKDITVWSLTPRASAG